jgi:hypothetical protein
MYQFVRKYARVHYWKKVHVQLPGYTASDMRLIDRVPGQYSGLVSREDQQAWLDMLEVRQGTKGRV